MTPWEATVATLALICIGSVVYLCVRVIIAALPPKRNRYLPKPRQDSRDWQSEFERGNRP